MQQESLAELLARVHERLRHTESLDPESRELLGTVMRDIEHTLGPGEARAESDAGTRAQLEELAVRFEAEHPALARALRQLMDLLGKAGI